jgi:glycosyltransferase involved in cell wall biosynthesis
MKILIANTLYSPDMVGGAEISTQILAEGLVASGAEVCVVCATGTGVDRVSELNGVKVYRLRLNNFYWPHNSKKHSRIMKMIWHAVDVHNVLMALKLKRIIEREKPDIVSTSNLACLSVGIWRMSNQAGVPIVHTARDYYLMCPSSKMLSHNKSCERQCGLCAVYTGPKRTESQRVDAVIGVSRFVLQKHIDSGYFASATTGVINDCYLPMQSEVSPVVRDVLREGVVRLGVLGRVSPEKGIEVLLDQLCRDSSLNWTLSIGGSGDAAYLATLKSTYNDPRVNFVGHVVPADFLRSIDILVVPSKWNEPFGRVTVEAYSHGIPVVGANTGGIPEVIEPSSNLIFDIDQPHTVIDKIHEAVRLLKDPQTPTRLRDYAETFSPKAMVDAYLEVYKNALKARPYPVTAERRKVTT